MRTDIVENRSIFRIIGALLSPFLIRYLIYPFLDLIHVCRFNLRGLLTNRDNPNVIRFIFSNDSEFYTRLRLK